MDERSTRILTLLKDASDYVSTGEIMHRLGISRRTVYYDLEKINDWLKSIHLPPVEYVRAAGFYLPEESRNRLPGLSVKVPSREYYLSPKERLSWLSIQLLFADAPLFVYHLTDVLQVSRGTVLKDLDLVRSKLGGFRLEVMYDRKQGYRIMGQEDDKRRALVHYFSQVINNTELEQAVSGKWNQKSIDLIRSLFPLMNRGQFKQMYQLIADSERTLEVELTDDMVFNLTARFLVYARRIQMGHMIAIDEDEMDVLRQMPEYKAAKRIASGLEEMFGIRIPQEEVGYLTMHMLGARVNRMERITGSDEMIEQLREAARRMTDAFQRHACLFLPNREAMEENLLVHMKPAYYRIKYGLYLENPLLENIRSKYREVFELTQRSVGPFEDLVGRKLEDNEIGYLSMHFGGWLRREKTKPPERRKAAIVCVNGISASRMLKSQLEHLFSAVDIIAVLSLREYEIFQDKVDFIFSTIPLPASQVPVFIVHPILSDKDKEHLLNQVNTFAGRKSRLQTSSIHALLDIVRKYAKIMDETGLTEELNRYMSKGQAWLNESHKPSLADLLTEPMIRMESAAKDWQSAIRTAAEPLLRDNRIEEGYIQAIISKVEALGPYIVAAPGIAIAHAKPEDGVRRLGISLLRLEKPVSFSQEERHQVRIILVLAAIDGESHLKALSELTIVLRGDKGIDRLMKAGTKTQMLEWIQSGSRTTR